MIEIDLVDREAIFYQGQWCCYEILAVTCPRCGRTTNVTVTYYQGTEYHHSAGDMCSVGWNNEPVPLGWESVSHLITLPGRMR